MTSPVLDASLFLSAISPKEAQHVVALAVYQSHPVSEIFLVPALFRVEVVAALVRRGEPDALVSAADAVIQGARFRVQEIDPPLIEEATRIARRAGIRGYDAIYVATALRHGAPLLTLDRDVADRVGRVVPELVVLPAG